MTRTLVFAAGGGRTLDVRNINGFIRVEGTNDSAVQMSIHKVIRAETADDLAEAQRDVRLDFRDGAPRVEAIGHRPAGPGLRRAVERRRAAVGPRRATRCAIDFTIRVPRDAALRLCTVNGGDVIVNGTQGDFDVSNVNGLIEMRQVAGSGRAHTVNGPVTVTFTANPKQTSSFKTVNGNVDVSFPRRPRRRLRDEDHERRPVHGLRRAAAARQSVRRRRTPQRPLRLSRQ